MDNRTDYELVKPLYQGFVSGSVSLLFASGIRPLSTCTSTVPFVTCLSYHRHIPSVNTGDSELRVVKQMEPGPRATEEALCLAGCDHDAIVRMTEAFQTTNEMGREEFWVGRPRVR